MTRVTLHPSLVQYRQDMAETVDQIRKENRLASPGSRSSQAPAPAGRDAISSDPCLAGLLTPPRIERLDLCLPIRGGRLDGYIHVSTSDEFGVMEVHVSLTDERGNQIESGYAMKNEAWPGHWGYMPAARVPRGISITVQVMAMDRLGGVASRSKSITVQ